jgi:hypothetical protein
VTVIGIEVNAFDSMVASDNGLHKVKSQVMGLRGNT